MTKRARPDRTGRRPISLGPTSGTVPGWLGLVIVAVVLVTILLSQRTGGGLLLALCTLLAGVLVWAVLLRPRVVVGEEELELRNAFVSRHIPYSAIESIDVRTATLVRAGGRRYVGAGVGRSVRTMVRAGTPAERTPMKTKPGQLGTEGVPDFLLARVRDKRAATGGPGAATGGPVRTSYAVPEAAAAAVLALAVLVTALLR